MQYEKIKHIIYRLDPETAHAIVEKGLHFTSQWTPVLQYLLAKKFLFEDNALVQEIFGKQFSNPVGVAAGFDKNATMIPALRSLGFGFVEFGTITPLPQDGNPKPRIFRYPKYNAIQNAMGFNNSGAVKVSESIRKQYPYTIPVGANIGKNKNTKEHETIHDYEILIETFKNISDFMVINLSSPNTPGLRSFQNSRFIKELFSMAKEKTNKPVLLKIAPDLDITDAIELCWSAVEHGAAGIVATNTTIDYTLLPGAKGSGGISGEPLKEKSFTIFEALAKEFFGKTILISAGGISDADEAYRRLKAGASLIELYSALIFKGPSVTKNINMRLIELMQRDGFKHISELIGADRK